MLEGILGRRGGLTPSKGKDSDSRDSGKHYSYFLTCSVDSFGFFFFFLSSVVVVNFIGTKKSNEALELFILFFSRSVTFFLVVINLCLYIGLLQFCGVLLTFFLFSFLFLIF